MQQIAGNIGSFKKYLTMLSSGSLKPVREVKMKVKSPAVGPEIGWIGEFIRPSLSFIPDIRCVGRMRNNWDCFRFGEQTSEDSFAFSEDPSGPNTSTSSGGFLFLGG